MPPSTPLPVKSRGSNFSFKLTGGISVGISAGGVTTWKPCGGGFAATTASGRLLWRRLRSLRRLQEHHRRILNDILQGLGRTARGLDRSENDHDDVDDDRV